ncbi:cytochrome P450 CYP82H23-like [Aristolochia californica]|uniref:cytochrome P450 CYP82H23-like n=1 Tax=Aristolochia californica TaxID=171875 RepID=UPI0035E16A5D
MANYKYECHVYSLWRQARKSTMSSSYYACFLVAILTISYLRRLWSKKRQQAHGHEPPEPSGSWPIVGHIPLLANNPLLHRHFAELADQHGPAFAIRVGQLRLFVVSSWELAKECLHVKDIALADRPEMLVAKHIPPFLPIAHYGPYWRESRKILIQNILSNRVLDSLQHVWISEMDILVRRLYAHWVRNSQELVDMKEELLSTLLNVFTRIVAKKRYQGSKQGNEEARQFIRLFKETLHHLGVQDVGDAFPFLRSLDLLGNEREMKKTGREIDELLQKWVDEHRQQNKDYFSSTSDDVGGAGTRDQDLIDALLFLEKENSLPNEYPHDNFIKGFINVR